MTYWFLALPVYFSLTLSLPPYLSLSLKHRHTLTHTHMHTAKHTPALSLSSWLSVSLYPVSTRCIYRVYSSLWSGLLFRGNKKPIWSWESQRSFEGSRYKANSWLYWDGWCGKGWAGFTCMEMRLPNPWSRNKSETLSAAEYWCQADC